MLLAQRDNAILNAMLSMDEVHNSVIEVFALYREHRAALTERLETIGVEGMRIESGVRLSAMPYVVNTRSLIDQLRDMAAREVGTAEGLLNRLVDLLRERGLITFKIELPPGTGPGNG